MATHDTPGGDDEPEKPKEDFDVAVIEWLKEQKLGDIQELFLHRKVTLAELCQFTPSELNNFADELGLDTLQKKRFMRGIQQLSGGGRQQQPQVTAVSGGTSMAAEFAGPVITEDRGLVGSSVHHLLVFPEEQAAINKLFDRMKAIDGAVQMLQQSAEYLASFDPSANDNEGKGQGRQIDDNELKVESVFDKECVPSIEEQQESLALEVDKIIEAKQKRLEKQLKEVRPINVYLQDSRSDLEKLINDASLGNDERCASVLSLSERVFDRKSKSLIVNPKGINNFNLVTTPEIALRGADDMSIIKFLSGYKVNKCDQPLAPNLTVQSCGHDSIQVSWSQPGKLHKIRQPDQYQLQYATLMVPSKFIPIVKNAPSEFNARFNEHVITHKNIAKYSSSVATALQQEFDEWIHVLMADPDTTELKWKMFDEGSIRSAMRKEEKRRRVRRRRHHKKVQKSRRKAAKQRRKAAKHGGEKSADTGAAEEEWDGDTSNDPNARGIAMKRLRWQAVYLLRVRERNRFGWSPFSNTVAGITKSMSFKFSTKNHLITVENLGLTAFNNQTYTISVPFGQTFRLGDEFEDEDKKRKKKGKQKISHQNLTYKCQIRFNRGSYFAIGVVDQMYKDNATNTTIGSANGGGAIYSNGCLYTNGTNTVYANGKNDIWKLGDTIDVTIDFGQCSLSVKCMDSWWGLKKGKSATVSFARKDSVFMFMLGAGAKCSISSQEAKYKH